VHFNQPHGDARCAPGAYKHRERLVGNVRSDLGDKNADPRRHGAFIVIRLINPRSEVESGVRTRFDDSLVRDETVAPTEISNDGCPRLRQIF